MQQTDAGDPGEYVINFSDQNAASPQSATRESNLMRRKGSMQNFDLQSSTIPAKMKNSGINRSQSSSDLTLFSSNLRSGSTVGGFPGQDGSKYQTKIGRRMTKLDDDFSSLSFTNQAEPQSALIPKDRGNLGDLAHEPVEVKRDDLRSHSRGDVRLRNGLLSKLTYEKIWLKPSEKPKQSQTCIIFDWDDTILCTTFLAPHT